MTLAELNTLVTDRLVPSLGRREAEATSRILFEDILGIDRTTLLVRGAERTVEPETVDRFCRFADRIAAGYPPQYIIGKARFMGMDFKVTPDTLIPRPETAELVDLVTDYVATRTDARGLRILDIGTGSGCIAIALARAIPFADIDAVDISDRALAVAKENNSALHTNVSFFRADILSDPISLDDYDIVVSNPPYIAESERADMAPRVKDYEPSTALFVPDTDPLLFYKAIVRRIVSADRVPVLLFEINLLFADRMKELCSANSLDCDIIRDSFGKERFAKCTPRR